MNPRIRELAEQAKAESSLWLGSEPVMTMTYDELEKFAKLIIEECCDVVRYIDAVDIKKHFGVEQ
jgi:hypothetical protein